MKIEIDIPDKVCLKDISIATCETNPKGLKARLEKKWRKYLRRYKPLVIPICCRFCADVGEAQYHCHSDTSPQKHLNVQQFTVCEHWSPNQGMIIDLHHSWFSEYLRQSRL